MGTDKALLPWPPPGARESVARGTFLSCGIQLLRQWADFVIVVAGDNESNLAPVVYSEGADLAVNPDPARGQFSSLQIGLHAVLDRGRDAAIVALVDRPPAKPTTVSTLRGAFLEAGEKIWAIVPEFSGKHGHPIVIGREIIEAFLQAPPTSTAREVEAAYGDRIRYLPVDDPFVALNINTLEEYGNLGLDKE